MKLKPNAKVLHLRTIIGVQFAGEIVTTLTSEKADMELDSKGVHIIYRGRSVLVPYSNIVSAQLELPEAAA